MNKTTDNFLNVISSLHSIDYLKSGVKSFVINERRKVIEEAKDIIFVVEGKDCHLTDVDTDSDIMSLKTIKESDYFSYGGDIYKTNLCKLYEAKCKDGKYYIPKRITEIMDSIEHTEQSMSAGFELLRKAGECLNKNNTKLKKEDE